MKKKQPKNLKSKTVKHWNEMITWAKKQEPDREPDRYKMEIAILQDWYAPNCPHCQFHYNEDNLNPCGVCPLHTKKAYRKINLEDYNEYGDGSGICCDGLWMRVEMSKTWKQWVDRAEDLLKYVRKYGDQK